MSGERDRDRDEELELELALELARCPECGAVAEVLTRFWLGSSDGPVEHARVSCLSRHGFVMPADRLQLWPEVAEPARPAARLRRQAE